MKGSKSSAIFVHMNQKMLTIAAIVTAAALTEYSQHHQWQHMPVMEIAAKPARTNQ
jgi:hypothetical protein